MKNRLDRYAVKVAEGEAAQSSAAPTGMSQETKDTLARMAITGGGGALSGVLLGWLLGHNKKQMARNAALFGTLGLGAGEGLNWYARQRDAEKPGAMEKGMEKAGAIGKTLGSMVPTSWGQAGKNLKDLATVNPLTNWITGIGDTLSGALLARGHLDKNLLTKSNVREVTAHRMKGIEAGIQKTRQTVVDNLGPNIWERFISGRATPADRVAVNNLFKQQAKPAAHRQMMEIAQRRADAQRKSTTGPTLTRNLARDAAIAETITGNFTKNEARILKQRLRETPDAKSRQAIVAEYPEVAQLLNPPKQGKGGKPKPTPIAFAPDELTPHVAAATSTNAPNVPRGGNQGNLGITRLARLKSYAVDPGGQGYAQPGTARSYGLDADDTAFGASRLGKFRRNPVKSAIGLSSVSRLINVLLDRYRTSQEPL